MHSSRTKKLWFHFSKCLKWQAWAFSAQYLLILSLNVIVSKRSLQLWFPQKMSIDALNDAVRTGQENVENLWNKSFFIKLILANIKLVWILELFCSKMNLYSEGMNKSFLGSEYLKGFSRCQNLVTSN